MVQEMAQDTPAAGAEKNENGRSHERLLERFSKKRKRMFSNRARRG
jgi:hypothetical protein